MSRRWRRLWAGLISRFLQIDSPLTQDQRAAEVARQLSAIGGSTLLASDPTGCGRLPDAVARALDLYLSQSQRPTVDAPLSAGIAALD